MKQYKLPDTAHTGYVHLKISNMDKALEFYKDLLGFQEIERSGGRACLSANGKMPYHIVLTEDTYAKPRKAFTTGLFHLAIRVPNRLELARMFLRLYEHHYPFHGFADHGVSEALYMADPEGNGVEIYVDRPKEQWPYKQGRLQMMTDPLDVSELVKELKDDKSKWNGIHPGTDIGHIHLQVSKLATAEKFYIGILGMDITQNTYPGALFMSAGGYHHHVGTNIWAGEGAVTPSPDSLGLAGYGIHIPGLKDKEILFQRFKESGIDIKNNDGGHFTQDLDFVPIELILN